MSKLLLGTVESKKVIDGFHKASVFTAEQAAGTVTKDWDNAMKGKGLASLYDFHGYAAKTRALDMTSFAMTDPRGYVASWQSGRSAALEAGKLLYTDSFEAAKKMGLTAAEAGEYAERATYGYLGATLGMIDEYFGAGKSGDVAASTLKAINEGNAVTKPDSAAAEAARAAASTILDKPTKS